MWRPFLVLSLLSLSAAGAQERLVRQAAPLPYVTLSAPGYSVRAEVRPAVVYPESGPDIGPYWQFSPAQVRVVLSPPGQPWKAQFPADMPPGYVTVTPVQNWLALYKGEARKEVTAELATLRSINAGKGDLKRLRREASLPYLPLMNAEQAVSGAVRRLNTAQLAGVRYLAVYAQDTVNIRAPPCSTPTRDSAGMGNSWFLYIFLTPPRPCQHQGRPERSPVLNFRRTSGARLTFWTKKPSSSQPSTGWCRASIFVEKSLVAGAENSPQENHGSST